MRRRALRLFERAERPAAWLLLAGAVVTFFGVLAGLIATGNAKWATLLVAADLMLSGVNGVRDSEDD